jgi:DNA invertase Pin-like site-specific DNA recombinase
MYKRAVIYARVSRAYKEDDDRITIEAQMSDCEAYCAKHGYSVVERYVDKDKYRARGKLVNPSGTRKDRPGYTAMLRAALADEFDVIGAWK